jgi:hypothetical protein
MMMLASMAADPINQLDSISYITDDHEVYLLRIGIRQPASQPASICYYYYYFYFYYDLQVVSPQEDWLPATHLCT